MDVDVDVDVGVENGFSQQVLVTSVRVDRGLLGAQTSALSPSFLDLVDTVPQVRLRP